MKQNMVSSIVRKLLLLSFVAILLITTSSKSQAAQELRQEINLASRLEKDASKIGKTTEVVDSLVMDAQKPTFLDEAIWNVEGLHLKRLSGAEGTLSIFSRGMRSTDSVLVFDGVKFRDPSDTQGSSAPMLQDILITPQDEIEIVKGSSSSVAGSTSQVALINLSRPYSQNFEIVFSEEAGSMRKFQEAITVADKNYRLDAIRLDTDRYQNTTFNGRFRLGNDSVSVEPFFYHVDSVAVLHDPTFILGGIKFNDSTNYLDKRENDLGLYGVKSELYLNDTITLYNLVALTDTDRRFTFGSFDSDGSFQGQDLTIDSYIKVNHSEILSSVIGYKYETESLNISQVGVDEERDATQISSDLYGEERIQLDNLSLLLQGRYNNQHGSKHALTYDISATYPIGRFSVASHFGTGFRNPALYERYGAFLTTFGIFDIGNSELSPEKSYTWDVGVKYSDDLNTIGVTPFISHIGNSIVLESAIYTNSEKEREAYGIESYYERFFRCGVSYRVNYTYTQGENLIDIPVHELGNSIIYTNGKFQGNVRVSYQSEKEYATFNLDTFMADKVAEEGGFLLGATASYEVNKNVEVYAKLVNLLDREYTDGGYQRHGMEAYAGVKITI